MALATLGVVVPGIAALYEFVVKGRKRLGFRVQMDTTATNVVETDDPGVFDQLREPLVDPTPVLLRIENNGQTHIDEDDYAVLHDKKAGVTVTFPDRKVVGMVVTELSDDGMRSSFEDGAGLNPNSADQPEKPYIVRLSTSPLVRRTAGCMVTLRARPPGCPVGPYPRP